MKSGTVADVVGTVFSELTRSAKQAPGWVPLVIVCYLLLPFANGVFARYGIDVVTHRILIVSAAALVLFVLGDALDQGVFPRQTTKGERGWRWIAQSSLTHHQERARDSLALEAGSYRVAKAVAVAAGKYTGTRIQFANEMAKFVRSAVIPAGAMGLFLLTRSQWIWALSAVLLCAALLLLYGRLKSWHMCALYRTVEQLSKSERERYVVLDLDSGVRLFFWNGELVSSGMRRSEAAQASMALSTASS